MGRGLNSSQATESAPRGIPEGRGVAKLAFFSRGGLQVPHHPEELRALAHPISAKRCPRFQRILVPRAPRLDRDVAHARGQHDVTTGGQHGGKGESHQEERHAKPHLGHDRGATTHLGGESREQGRSDLPEIDEVDEI